MSAINTVLRTLALDEKRGRVLSVWRMIGAGVLPLGSPPLGELAGATGRVTLAVGMGYGDPRRDSERDPARRIANHRPRANRIVRDARVTMRKDGQ
jgi:hypothetical protein